ncbi:creatininase family protein [Hyphococcus lacteus]|uniref:Creatininase family protein n=1 Tax=Hyphococcus lacteus TaxID=3143536 RepID=A0ABV3ZAZ7_9PROT
MELQLSTWPEIETYLKRSRLIVIPIGSMEQHGPTGLIGTDFICPEVIARKASKASDVMVGPTFNVGVAQHHMSFAGSICLRPSTMIAVMNDWTNALAHHGFNKLVWLNGHGGNIATINAAFAEYYHQRNYAADGIHKNVRCILRNWWDLRGIADLCARLYPEGHGQHATISEVAVTYFCHPELSKTEELSPKIAPKHEPFTDADDYRRKYPDGRIGSDPSLARAKDGALIIETATLSLAEELKTLNSES